MSRVDYRRTMPRNRKILAFHLPNRHRSWRRLVLLGLGLLALMVLQQQYLQLDAPVAFLLEKAAIIFIVSPICYTVAQWWLRRGT